jgi:hypothetical protein
MLVHLENPSEDKMISAGAAQNARCEMSLESTEKVEGKRKPITQDALETALAEAVRALDPKCKGLVGIIVERVSPVSSGNTNWSVKGVRYGKVERDCCDVALSICVEEMQGKFEVSG